MAGETHDQLSGVWRAVLRLPAPHGGRAVMFLSTRDEDDAPAIARAFAESAALRAPRGVWLVDLDFAVNGQLSHYQTGAADAPIGAGRDSTFGQTPFWRLAPPQAGARPVDSAPLLSSHRIGSSRLFVSRFRLDAVPPNWRVEVAPEPAYWAAAKGAMDLIVVDAPPLDRSRSALALARDMDGVILVVDSDVADLPAIRAAREEIEARGGRVIGVVLNRAPPTVGWGGALDA